MYTYTYMHTDIYTHTHTYRSCLGRGCRIKDSTEYSLERKRARDQYFAKPAGSVPGDLEARRVFCCQRVWAPGFLSLHGPLLLCQLPHTLGASLRVHPRWVRRPSSLKGVDIGVADLGISYTEAYYIGAIKVPSFGELPTCLHWEISFESWHDAKHPT